MNKLILSTWFLFLTWLPLQSILAQANTELTIGVYQGLTETFPQLSSRQKKGG